jgi:hypothetical protein
MATPKLPKITKVKPPHKNKGRVPKTAFKKGKEKTGGRSKGRKNNTTLVKIALGLKNDENLPNEVLKMATELWTKAQKNWDNQFLVFKELIGVTFSKKADVTSGGKPIENGPVVNQYSVPAFKGSEEEDE